MHRTDDEKPLGITDIKFTVDEQMYALVGDILTGRLRVEPKPEDQENTPEPQ